MSSESRPICQACQAQGRTRKGLATLDFSPSSSRLLAFAFVVSQSETRSFLWDRTCSRREAIGAGNMLESVCGILHPQHHMFRHAYNHLGGNVLKETDVMQAFESLVTIVQCCQRLVPCCPGGAPVRALCNLLGDEVSNIAIGLHGCPTCQLAQRCAPAPPL